MQKRVVQLSDDTLEAELIRIALDRFDFQYSRVPIAWEVSETDFIQKNVDVIIFDIGIEDFPVLRTIEEIRTWKSDVGVVILTDCPDLRLLGLSLRELPFGSQILHRGDTPEISSLVEALHRSVTAAREREDARVIPLIPRSPQNSAIASLSTLQLETLRLLASGLSNAEIARSREVSEKSIEHMIAKIAQNLELKADSKINLRVCLAREYYVSLGTSRI
jgi:DNA-binding NarL/FixJ family response regulator